MNDLSQLISEISKRELSRKQFLIAIGTSFLGMIGVLRVLQALNTPTTAKADSQDTFGSREYGHAANSPTDKTS